MRESCGEMSQPVSTGRNDYCNPDIKDGVKKESHGKGMKEEMYCIGNRSSKVDGGTCG